ncbi:MAG: serine/threonine protein kinase [Myxococcales bacterium]|nr:serine/threonine protein kinase [Myxococcales bacterium]
MEQPRSEWIGRYKIVDEIGVGGMAIALRCILEGIGGFRREVVIKVIRPEHSANESFVRMFLDEARLAASICHSNVAQVFEVDRLGNLPYIVMEYVHGPHLGQLLRSVESRDDDGTGRHFGHVARVLADVCRGLQVAHDAGMVHRDVTPQNIVVSTSGQAKLIDFGIAKARGRLEHTEEGRLKGKRAFIAPEMLEGGAVTPAADIYAVGICSYRALTGAYPFDAGDPRATLARILAGDAVPPSQIRPQVPVELERIVMQCLARDPSERYPSAAQLAEALEAFCRGGAFASDLDGVKDWVARVFPLGETQWRGVRSSGRGIDALAATLPSQLDEQTTENLWKRVAEPRLFGGMAGASMMFVVAVIAWVLLYAPSGRVPTLRPAVVDHDSPQALAYLTEAERHLTSGDPQTAGVLLDRARPLLVTPGLVARHEALTTRVDRALQSVLTADPLGSAPQPSRVPRVEEGSSLAEPAPTDPSPTGLPQIGVAGDADRVWLVRGGRRHELPGRVPPGTYEIVAMFAGGEPVSAGQTTVAADQRITCAFFMARCKAVGVTSSSSGDSFGE